MSGSIRPGRLLWSLLGVCAAASVLGASPASGRNAYIAAAQTVVVLDTAANPPAPSPIPFPTGSSTNDLAITPDGARVYVAVGGKDTVTIIDTATNAIAGSPISLPSGAGPVAIAITPDGTRAYVANYNTDDVSVIDLATNAIVGSPIPVGDSPLALAISPDGARVYVVNSESNNVSVIDTATNEAVGSAFPVGESPQAIVIAPDGSRVFVANCGNDHVTTYHTATNTLVNIPTAVGDCPIALALTPDGSRLYAANSQDANVSVIDASTLLKVGTPIAVGTYPDAIAVTPDGSRAYVGNYFSLSVSVIDTVSNAVVGSEIPVGSPPTAGLAVVPNQGPTALFAARNATGTGSVAGLDAGASSDPDGSPARFDWDFGDGSVQLDGGPTPLHDYPAQGTYTATLTVTDNEGCSTTVVFGGRTVFCNGSPKATVTEEVDLDPPRLRLSGRKGQTLGKAIRLKASSDEQATATAEGVLAVAGPGRGNRVPARPQRFRLKQTTKAISGDARTNFKLKLSKPARHAAQAALAESGKVNARIRVIARDGGENVAKARRAVTLEGG